MIPELTDWLPLEFHTWMPRAQAVALGLLTFIQEDVPTVGAALLSSAGVLSWKTGYLGVFLGIWVGDALLYLLARGIGRPLLLRPWARRILEPSKIAQSERWFAQKGTWLLASSRFVPGTRLPTYLAAGFLKVPFGRFLLVTGIAAAAWTAAIFLAADRLGDTLWPRLQQWNLNAWLFLPVLLCLVLLIRVSVRLGDPRFRRRIGASLGRWAHWEFWPSWLFYAPVLPYFFYLAIRHRGLTLPSAANPGIFSGGIVGESKMETLRDLRSTSPELTAETFLLEPGPIESRATQLAQIMEQHSLQFPVILKPDVGQRGVGVKLIRSQDQAMAYLQATKSPLLLQRYAPGPGEIGVFYYRFPHESKGHIFAITEKIFPVIVGDGRHTLEELLLEDPRARFIVETYLRRMPDRRNDVLAQGETIKLVEAGNHAQGCLFRDGRHLCSEALESRIDSISQRLDGFYIGRYDLRYESEQELRAGRGFTIIELNGAASEATSLYDARNSLMSAYRTLFEQWGLVFAIGAANRRRGIRPTTLRVLWRAWRDTQAKIATYPLAD